MRACLVKSLYAIPTWSRTARLIAEHRALADAIGGTPSKWALYRFCRKLREHNDKLADCLDRIAAALHEELPDYGRDVSIDASDLPAYANGQRFLSKHGPERERYSDPDASWATVRRCPPGRAAALRLSPPCGSLLSPWAPRRGG